MGRERALLLALILVGCDRAPSKDSPPATAVEPGALTKVVVPTQAAPIVEPAAPVEPAPGIEVPPTPETVDIGTPKPATKGKPRTVTAAPTPRAATAPPAPPLTVTGVPPTVTGALATSSVPRLLVSDKLFRVEIAPLAPCKVAAACTAKLVVHALGGYKVNAEYPSKFVAKPAPGVAVEGTGSFAVGSKTIGTMTVTFRAAAAGTAKIVGALKLSVCTDEVCEIAAPVIAFDVPVTPP